jgi:hypothetical protein
LPLGNFETDVIDRQRRTESFGEVLYGNHGIGSVLIRIQFKFLRIKARRDVVGFSRDLLNAVIPRFCRLMRVVTGSDSGELRDPAQKIAGMTALRRSREKPTTSRPAFMRRNLI